MKPYFPKLDWKRINLLISLALEEDLGKIGDVTTIAIINKNTKATASIICRENCICAGLPIAEAVFKRLDKKISFTKLVSEGEFCKKNTILAKISGKANTILSGERTALNFLQRLSGIATTSYKYSKLVRNTKTIILDTRKTTPGWRNLEKYAVALGGASNHRFGLYDRVMIKDNHLALANISNKNSLINAVSNARKKFPQLKIEIEADNLEILPQILEAKPDYILLDNMSIPELKKALKIIGNRAKTEVSGGITFDKIAKIAKLGADFISCGALTHSVKAIDISLEVNQVN